MVYTQLVGKLVKALEECWDQGKWEQESLIVHFG